MLAQALPPGPQPEPKRQVFVGTSLVAAAGSTLIGGMLAVWLRFRAAAPDRPGTKHAIVKDWLPTKLEVPGVAANIIPISIIVVCVMAQWAVYAAKRDYRPHAGMAFGTTFLFGLGVLNAQIYIYSQMNVSISENGAYAALFYAMTGTLVFLLLTGLVYTAVTAIRYLGGRSDVEMVSSHALYWYFLTAATIAVWFVVYIQK
jgi:heme/copper-type cytochrome/quinol oxidase subunit 3